MTQYPQQQPGQPWGSLPPAQQPSGKESTGQPGVKSARPWFRKKRVVIPGGVVALFIAIGIATAGADDHPATPGSIETSTVAEATPDAAAAEEAAAEERAAAVEAATKEAEEAAAEEAAAAAAGTVSQQNAKRSAESYLGFSGFSREGLIEQLEFEGFSTEDATWAVDHVSVDWLAEAVESAESYLSFAGFSRTGLIGQLEFEGYPSQDATSAVDSIDVDWNAEAAESAKSYLEFSAFSRSGLIDQLIFEGFTPEQADHGVSQSGL